MQARAYRERGRRPARCPGATQDRRHEEAGFIEADQVGALAPECFYARPILLNPLAHATIVALFRAGLWALGTEAARTQQIVRRDPDGRQPESGDG